MERINPYAFYDIGKEFRTLEQWEGDVAAEKAFVPVMNAAGSIERLLEGKLIPLGLSTARAQAFSACLRSIMEHFHVPNAEGKPELHWPKSDDPPIPAWKFGWLRRSLAEFETVFGDEMRETASYFVPRRGIYFTPALVDNAEETFPKDIMHAIPQKAKEEWRSAGRCLAFNLLSASGFHAARAVEATLEAYYQLFCGKPGETLHGWHDYTKALEELTEKNQTPAPQAKTLAEIDQMRKDYRNPIMHPRVVLTEGDARMLFANGESLIIAMAQEIAAAQKGVQPALALIGGTAPNGQAGQQPG